MSINRVVIGGFFSFPYGDAPGARMRNLALGLKDHIDDVCIVSAYFSNPPDLFKADSFQIVEGVKFSVKSIIPIYEGTSSVVSRLSGRFQIFKVTYKLVDKIIETLRGDEKEMLFLYGRSFIFLNSLLNKLKLLNYKTKVIFDVVELPRNETSIWEYFIHPLSLDSVLVYRKLLDKFDACTFISYKLKEDFNQQIQKSIILPSIIHKYRQPSFNSIKNKTIKIGYLGTLYEKDYPELLYSLCSKFYEMNIPFELSLVGRFRNFSEGRIWEQRFKSCSYASHIKFFHEPDEGTKLEILNNVDFLAVFRKPERVQAYTFPTRVPELLSLGKILLVNNFGDFKYYFKDLENSVVISIDNIEEGSRKIVKTLEPLTYNLIVKNSLSLLDGPFNASVQSKKLLDLLS